MSGLTAIKAKTILKDGTIRGKALSPKQKKFFGRIVGEAKTKAKTIKKLTGKKKV